jgi:chemotaxis signal transduction protein
MDLLLSTLDLREVVASTPIAPLPGRPRGIYGVVIYQGEFLPVLAWKDLPGCQTPPGKPMAMAVLRPRIGTISPPPEAWQDVDPGDARERWLGGVCRVEGQTLLLVDPDRLIALLHRLREER